MRSTFVKNVTLGLYPPPKYPKLEFPTPNPFLTVVDNGPLTDAVAKSLE